MRINYKIIWVDDEPDDMEAKKALIYDIVKKHYMFPEGMESPYTSFKKFKKDISDKYTPNKFVDCDIILIDYNLSDSGDNTETGEELIKQLRDKGIYTDVLFYSGNMQKYRKNKKYPELDNVVYSDSDTDEFQIKFEKILIKQVNISMGIQNIRGYLMDATSDFDFISRNYVEQLYKVLGESQKQYILDKIRLFIENQKTIEEKKFEKVAQSYNKDSLIKPSMSSLDYVMSVRNKMYVLAMILFYQNKLVEIDDVDDVDEFATKLANAFQDEIISHRNKLAHSKLKYGDNNYSHVKILKHIEDLSCVCEKCNEDKYYTLEDCANIRKNIYNTYKVFYKLYDELEKNFNEKQQN